MRVINNIGHAVIINDVGRTIYPTSKGPTYIPDDIVGQSDELIAMARSGKVTFCIKDGRVRQVAADGEALWDVDGTEIWPGHGKTHPVIDERQAIQTNATLNEIICSLRSSEIKKRRFKIAKGEVVNISLESIGKVLSRENPALIVSEEEYNNLGVRRAISSGAVKLVGVEESSLDERGELYWKALDLDKVVQEERRFDISKFKCCFWEGPIFDAGGYANMNRQYIFNLPKFGVFAKPALFNTLMDVEASVKGQICNLATYQIHPNSPRVFATNVPNAHSGRSIAYTMMETEDRVHPALAKSMDPSDELWVPSEWNKQTFFAGGVRKPIYVMPLGVDVDSYKPRKSRIMYAFPKKRFVFLSVFNWNWRKGYDVLLKAYAQAFSADDDVTLVLVSRYQGQSGGVFLQQILQDISQVQSTIGKPVEKLPHLVLVNQVIPTEVMPYLYNTADAFSLFSRGEGWGLPYCEAAASGVPVVGAYHGGQKMFLNNGNAMLVTPDVKRRGDQSINRISPFYPNMLFVDYSSSAISYAADLMKQCFENYDDAKVLAKFARERILQDFTWERAAERVAVRIKEIG